MGPVGPLHRLASEPVNAFDLGTILPLMGVGCDVQKDGLGSSSNAFTNILTEANVVAVDNDINSVVFLHRNNASAFGGNSGSFRYSLSTDGGVTWVNNQGPVNPLVTNPGRYPSVAIYNPPGNTTPALARLQYYAPTVVAGVFNGHVSGGRNLDGTANTEFYNQAGATQTLIPRSLVKGEPGVFWSVDFVYTGTTYTGIRVLKGTWSGSDVVWAVNNTISPTFNTAYSGAVQVADLSMAFDPSGMHGFIALLTHVTPGPSTYSFYPVLWETTDGGATWGTAQQVDVAQFPCVTSLITAGNFASTGFDLDLTVDKLGNPHVITTICNGNNAYAVFFSSAHHVFDITRENGIWNAVDLANVQAGRTTFGTSPNVVSYDSEPQASRTDDGSKVFFTWVGSEPALTLGGTNPSPNLWAIAYDVDTRTYTAPREVTSCNISTLGKAFFPKMAENVLNHGATDHRLPVVTLEMTSADPLLVANFTYMDSLIVRAADYVSPLCEALVNITGPDTVIVCEGDSVNLISSGMDVYLWSTGESDSSIWVSDGGWYHLGARDACCIGKDSVFVWVDSLVTADYTVVETGLIVDFFDASTGGVVNWAWDFGDGGTDSSPSPNHAYAGPGTYVVCLIVSDACSADTICDTITITCASAMFGASTSGLNADFTDMSSGGTVFSYSWDFGDGSGTSSAASPSYSYASEGTYVVCLTITDSCGTDTYCDTVSIVCPVPVAGFTWMDMGLGVVDFTNASTGGTVYAWDFGDGTGTSSSASPSYTYALTGSYNVCLTITDSCGSATLCDSIFVIIDHFTDPAIGGLQIAPNPAHDRVQVSGLLLQGTDVALTLTNALGQQLLSQSAHAPAGAFRRELDLSSASPGIYFLRVQTSTGSTTLKVVVE
jgi:PKD repeat protein